MIEKKYKITDETIIYFGRVLKKIEALKDFANVHKGDKGGYVETENNLSQEGDCWIYEEAKVFDFAKIYDNAKIGDYACIFRHAKVYGNALICHNARVFGNAQVFGNAVIYNNAVINGYAKVYDCAVVRNSAVVGDSANIHGHAKIYFGKIDGDADISNMSDYIIFKNWWSSGRFFIWTKSNNMWSVGCFYGTGKELIEKAYKDSELSGREYERIVKYVESIVRDNKL